LIIPERIAALVAKRRGTFKRVKNWCRPPQFPADRHAGSRAHPRSVLPHWLLPFSRQKATAPSGYSP